MASDLGTWPLLWLAKSPYGRLDKGVCAAFEIIEIIEIIKIVGDIGKQLRCQKQ
jgi:hypothetical protein